MFTNTTPELRRIVPQANGRVTVKIVYTVLEAQYQSSISSAVNQINATNKDVCVEVCSPRFVSVYLSTLPDELICTK